MPFIRWSCVSPFGGASSVLNTHMPLAIDPVSSTHAGAATQTER